MNVKDFMHMRVRVIVLCLFALGALTLPASAVAAGNHNAHAHGAKAKGKKKKKKKPTTTVIVKCASVTVTCKGTPGATGPQGPAGANGTSGSAVVFRARGIGSTAASKETYAPGCDTYLTCVGGANVPLSPSPATWTQGPTEDDQMIGTITISLPNNTECAAEEDTYTKEPDDTYAEVIVTVNGVVQGFAYGEAYKTAHTVSAPIFGASIFYFDEDEGEYGAGFFIGNGSDQTHTVAITVADNCTATPVTVSNAAVDVLASY